MQRLWRLRWCSDYGDRVGAAIAVMAASAQRLRRWRRWRSDCGGGVGCGSVGVGWRSDSGDSGVLAVVAIIAVTAAFLQSLRRWRWLSTAIVAAALVQRLQRRLLWRRDCGRIKKNIQALFEST